jgi:hypothetical protein
MNDDFDANEPTSADDLVRSVLRDARAHAQPERHELASAFLGVQERLRQPEPPPSPSAAALPRRHEARVTSSGHLAGPARIIGWSALAAALGFWLGTRYERGLVHEHDAAPLALELPAAPAPAAVEATAVVEEPTSMPAVAAPASHAVAAPAAQGDAPRTSARARAHLARPTPRQLDFRQVLELLRRAERARQGGTPELALVLLEEIDRGASRDVLREERVITRTLALCDQGNDERARASARELAREDGASIYTSRLSQSCAASATLESDDNR